MGFPPGADIEVLFIGELAGGVGRAEVDAVDAGTARCIGFDAGDTDGTVFEVAGSDAGGTGENLQTLMRSRTRGRRLWPCDFFANFVDESLQLLRSLRLWRYS